VLASGVADALSPAAFERYFPLYYAGFHSRDKHGIVEHLRHRGDFAFDFRSAAEKFRLVDDAEQASVIVPYASTDVHAPIIEPLIARLSNGEADRWLLRKLQRYSVNLPRRLVSLWQQRGDVLELQPGVHVLTNTMQYDTRLGLLQDGHFLDPSVLVQ
jgi:CRISPR-associated endonuclease/helicase Cas3